MGTKRPPETTAAPATVELLRKSRREADADLDTGDGDEVAAGEIA
jgi:hypothetical protein